MDDEALRPTVTISGVEYEVTGDSWANVTLVETICRRYGLGEAVRSIVADYPEIPSEWAFRRAVNQHDWISAMWMEAQIVRADKFAEEIVEIADDTSKDMYLVEKGESAFMAPNMAAVARAKLRVETRKGAMRQLNPKKYAEKMLALEEGVGGLVISWSGGQVVGRMPRKAIPKNGAVPVTIDGDVIEAEIIEPDAPNQNENRS